MTVGKTPVIGRIARWNASHPWVAMVAWAVIVVGALMIGGRVGVKQATDADLGIGQSGQAVKIINHGHLGDPDVENVLITPGAGGWDRQAAQGAAADAVARMRGLSQVTSVGQPLPSPKSNALLVSVTVKGDSSTADGKIQPLLDATAAVRRAHPQVRVELVGVASVRKAYEGVLNGDLGKATELSTPITLLITLIAFGAFVAAGVPIILGLLSVGTGLGLWFLASHVMPDPGPVQNMIVLIGMAVGVDYSLFYLKREREERALGTGKIDAIEIAAATSGHAVLVSGCALIASMAGLYFGGHLVFSAMATGAIIVVAVAMLSSLTVLPAMLSIFGRALERPRVPFVWRLTTAGIRPRVWSIVLRPTLRHPVVALVLGASALLGLGYPALHMSLHSPGLDDLPRSMPEMRAYDRMIAAFPSEGNEYLIAVRAPADRSTQVRAGLATLVRQSLQDPLFSHAQPPQIQTSADRTVSMVKIVSPYPSNGKQGLASLHRLRDDLVPADVGRIPGAKAAVGGSDTAYNADYNADVSQRMPWVVGFALLLSFGVMTFSFRSIVIGLVTVFLNVLSACAAFGLLVLVFQHTWAEKVLGFTSTGHVIAWLPLLLFVVLLGLSMDYHVFVISRIREATLAGGSTREAVERGISRSAGVVTSAAAVMISVFALFASLDIIEMKQMGVGAAGAILIDATVIRVVLLPAILTLLGQAAWWPSRLFREHPQPPIPSAVPDPGSYAR